MRGEFEFDCTYGSGHTESTCYYYNGWYCTHGSTNVNFTIDEINRDGITDVDSLHDIDIFTAAKPINSLEELIMAVDYDGDDDDDVGDEEDEDYYSSLLYGVDNNQ